jgi:hypothetical protein
MWNGDGLCFVGVEHLAEDCELDTKIVRRRLQWLEDVAGVIKREPQWLPADGTRNSKGVGRRTTDTIRLLIGNGEGNSSDGDGPVSPPPGGLPPKDLDCLSLTASPPLTLPLRGGPNSLNLNLNQDADAGEARARERLVSDEAFKLADEITTLVGLDPKHPPPAWCGAAMHVAKWLRQGWDRELILVGARTAMARRSTAPHSIRYFEPAIAEELARQQAPLPKAEIPRTPEDQHAKPTERRSVTAVLREQLAAARERERDNPSRGDYARLLPPG